jgi:predicted lipoprotein with Yx(FWY)xxD motif
MHHSTLRGVARSRVLSAAAALAIAAIAALVTVGASHAAVAAKQPVVRTAKSAALGQTILVDRHGMTLYDLSVERHGRFVCTTSACLALWKPLVVAKGTTPAGAKGLGTVRRPDGRRQVTYNGAPLYTFTQDEARGDVTGNGFRDVGVWRPATLSGTAPFAPSVPSTGGGYRY